MGRSYREIYEELHELDHRESALLAKIRQCGSCDPDHLECDACEEFREERDAILAAVRACFIELSELIGH